jgi:nucleotide-binding universal stress UspA family protein
MSGIICAIRGGPASQPTIDYSIQLANETDQDVRFLYVINIDFLERTESSRVQTISVEMEHMGEFILLLACDGANSHGVKAEGTVRHGNISDEIIQLATELDAKHVVLGSPRGDGDEDVFTQERLGSLRDKIEQYTGAEVILLQT